MENKILDETLTQNSDDLGSENLSGGGENVVVKTTTLVETTKITVVENVGENKEDVLRREMEGVFGDFGDLVEDDEGMDVDGFLASGNGSAVEPGLGGEVDGNDNEGQDMMDVGLSGEGEKNAENGAEVVEAKKGTEKSGEGEVKNGLEVFEWNDDVKKDEGNGEKGEENGGKVAEKEEENDGEDDEMEEDHDYVVGDFVWGKIKSHPWWPGQIYDPSNASDHANTLKRKGRLLVAYFGDGSFSWCSPSQLKPFVDNFQAMADQSDSKKFVNAVQKALEQVSKLVQAESMSKPQTDDRVENICVGNSGIKEGVPVPKGNTIKVLVDRMAPVELLSTLKAYATMDPGTRLLKLELAVLKSCLSAFYIRKGGYLLPEYQNPKYIEGLEDEKRSRIVGDSNVNGPSEGDNAYQKRKKSVAQLMGRDEPNGKKAKSSSGIKRERKWQSLVVSVEPESDHESVGGVAEDDMVSPRQRKKSKYLSPPYYSPKVSGKLSGSGSFKETNTEGEKAPEMAATQHEDSLKKSSGKRSRPRKAQQEHKKTIDADVDVDNVLNGLLRAALDPSGFVEKNLPAITDFISSFRGSIFEEGSKSNDMTDVKKDGIVTDVKKNVTPTDVKKDGAVTTLVIEFPPEATLPTKWELSKTYKNFGDYVKKESHISGSSAFVVFGSSSDAEAALAMSLEKKPLGGGEYYLSEEVVLHAKRGSKKVASEDMSDLAFIEQKLETMSEMVKKCAESEMSSEVKANLEGGFTEVLEKVGKMRAK